MAALRKASHKCFQLSGSWLFTKASTFSLINSVCTILTLPPQKKNLVFFSVGSVIKHILHAKWAPKCCWSPCPVSVSWCYCTHVNRSTITFCYSRRLVTTRKELSITDTLHQLKILNKKMLLEFEFQSMSDYIPHISKKQNISRLSYENSFEFACFVINIYKKITKSYLLGVPEVLYNI